MSGEPANNKAIYEAAEIDGTPHGKVGAFLRFADTAKHLSPEADSILDVGCFSGEWLHYILGRRRFREHMGIDVAQNKIDAGLRAHPELNLKCAYAESVQLPEGSFDIVTCLETLEHIPDWEGVFNALFRLARKQVLITVPYREEIRKTICIHCAKLTPVYGHLRTYSEDSFPERPGWSRRILRIPKRSPERSVLFRLYRWLSPHWAWLLADYRRTKE